MKRPLENSKLNLREKLKKPTGNKISFMRLLKKLSLLKMKSTSLKMNYKTREESQQLIRTKLKNTNKFLTQKKINWELPKNSF